MEKKQSQILHVSVCGNWLRHSGKYLNISKDHIFDIKAKVKWDIKVDLASKYWANGTKHPARELDFITAEEWLILN